MRLTLATRKSPLALWQAHYIQARLQSMQPSVDSQLLALSSQGDLLLDTPLAKIGGKGLFLKELEAALLDGRADLAVHSMKDVPMALPSGLCLAAICEREEPRDAFVSTDYADLDALPKGAVVGTSSLRRQAQILAYRPDLKIQFLRGNVNSRLAKLDDGQYDAIILAAAGLMRLGLHQRIRQCISSDICLPAVGQGAVGIECRQQDKELVALLQSLNCDSTLVCLSAERALSRRLEGGCQVPIAGYAERQGERLFMRARVGQPDGSLLLKVEQSCELQGELSQQIQQAEQLGTALAEQLLAQGADRILSALSL